MSFLANSLRACFYRTHREHSTREAELCFQETPERYRGPDRTTSLLLRWRKRRAALHGATLRAAGLGKQCRGRRGQREERRGEESSPCAAAPPKTVGASPRRGTGLPGIFRPGRWFLPVLTFSSAFFIKMPTEVAKIQVHDALLLLLFSSGHRC